MQFQCVICFNQPASSDEPRHSTLHSNSVCTPCGHVYHMDCLYRWCEAKRSSNWDDGGDLDDYDVNCPMCNNPFNEDECQRLYPAEIEMNDQGTQTDQQPIKEDFRRQKNILVLDAAFQNFVRRVLTEKWAAEFEVDKLKLQVRKLQVSVVELIHQNLELAVKNGIAEQVIRAQSALASSSRQRSNWGNTRLEEDGSGGRFKKRRSIWWRIFKTFVHPGCDAAK